MQTQRVHSYFTGVVVPICVRSATHTHTHLYRYSREDKTSLGGERVGGREKVRGWGWRLRKCVLHFSLPLAGPGSRPIPVASEPPSLNLEMVLTRQIRTFQGIANSFQGAAA